jgi:iron complex outermembrane receptor protein
MKKRKGWFLLAGIVAATFTVTLALNLFSAPSAAAQEKKADEEYKLETMMVTAQKKEENVQDVPISMDVFTDIQLEDAGIEDISDLVRFAPNVHLQESSAENVLIIRGISSFDTSIYSPAGFYVDDVNYPLHYMYNTDLFDLERVEVLRGPQGTLYGRNSESGVINLVTKQPDNYFRAKVLSEYGSYNSWRFGANVSGPIAKDKLYLGVALQYKLSDGYMENKFNDNDETAEKDHKNGRATLRWTPTEDWDISLIADAMDTDDQQIGYRYRTGPFATDYYDISHNITDEYSKQEGNGQTLRLKYKGDSFNLLSVTGLRNYEHKYTLDTDNTADPGPWFNWGDACFKYEIEHMSEEFRISSPDNHGPFEWLMGVYGFKEETDISQERMAWGMAADTDIDIDGYAAFGQGTYTLFDKLHLTAGLRFDHQDLKGKMKGNGMVGPIDQDKDLDYDEFLPKFSVGYDFSKDIMAYVSASKGYMVGGYNYGYMPTSEDAFYYDPEYTWNYEAGMKSSWFDKKLLANLSIFYIDIDDKQVVEWSMTMGTKVENAAKAHSQGIELELQARPVQGLDMFAGFGYTESKFDDWKALQKDGTMYDYEDNYLPNAPKYTYNLGAAYRHISGLFGRVDLLGTGEFYGDNKNTLKQEDYELVNLRLGYEGDNLGISFWCTNLFDEEYVTALYDMTNMGLGELVQDGEPRMLGVTVSYRF